MPSRTTDEVIPNPDPSRITSEQIEKAVANSESKINTKIDGIEKAIEVQHEDLVRVPTLLDRAIGSQRELTDARFANISSDIVQMRVLLDVHEVLRQVPHITREAINQLHGLVESELSKLNSIMDERFRAVDEKFSELGTRTDQRAGDTKLAVDAAFAAANISTGKIEAGFTKSIDEQAKVIAVIAKNSEDKIADLKDRITTLESRGNGMAQFAGWIFAGVGMFVGLTLVGIALIHH
jgi:hypothetical protein